MVATGIMAMAGAAAMAGAQRLTQQNTKLVQFIAMFVAGGLAISITAHVLK